MVMIVGRFVVFVLLMLLFMTMFFVVLRAEKEPNIFQDKKRSENDRCWNKTREHGVESWFEDWIETP
jgi:hypothetical protein